MKRTSGKRKKKPTYNRTSVIRGALRRAFSRDPIVGDVLSEGRRFYQKFNKDGSRAKKDGVERHCQVCNQWVRAPIGVSVDHIDPVVPLNGSFDPKNPDWVMFMNRLWCDKSNLQRICDSCHDAKTKRERVERKMQSNLRNTEMQSTAVKPDKIELKTTGDGFSTGANSALYINGVKLTGVTRVAIEVAAGGLAQVTVQMVGNVSANINGEAELRNAFGDDGETNE
jgi:5-methylcytosine-specific restriction endonuclease McrA